MGTILGNDLCIAMELRSDSAQKRLSLLCYYHRRGKRAKGCGFLGEGRKSGSLHATVACNSG